MTFLLISILISEGVVCCPLIFKKKSNSVFIVIWQLTQKLYQYAELITAANKTSQAQV